ncbi:hypothetical protein ACZ91_57225 [Streptomyces regensis]|nr:hypothetical protein ACZ91_57225 [Streptomyces regensis]
MTRDTRAGRSLYRWLATACVAALLLSGGLWWMLREQTGLRVTAHFDRAVGLYAGSSVRVLGIEVGEITRVEPRGRQVVVDMQVDEGVRIPADADAVVVAPSLVSDRYVQLTPVYDGGPVMRSAARIPLERTATPMEIDDLYRSLDELSTALGPAGANSDGALSRALDTAAANLDGNGENLNTTVTRLSELATTLDGSKGDLFGTVRNLQRFTKVLADSDAQLNSFYSRLNQVRSGSIAIRYNLNELTNPLMTTACKLTDSLTDRQLPDALTKLCDILGPVVDGVAKAPSVSQLLASIQSGELPPLPLPLIVAPGGRS